MAAREGMAELVQQLRALCNAGVDDTTVAGVTYWSDDQLEAALDRTRRVISRGRLDPLPTYEDGAWVYRDYGIPTAFGRHFEEAGTDSGWAVRDGSGTSVTGWTANYDARRITFGTDQGSKDFYLDARAYNVYAAAAAVWRQKAALAAQRFDWSTDNHNMKASQEYAQCMKMAQMYAGMTGVQTSRFVRVDEA